MTVGKIAVCIIVGMFALGGVGFGLYLAVDFKVGGIVTAIVSALVGVSIIIGIVWFAYNTEAGKRAYKDQQSNFGNGIERTVSVYDMQGELIKQYSGKFDVETNSTYVLFDDEKGKRHMIYYTTGTVIVDEK